ncbi:IS110 family transposase [Wolbachia endosymbiont (group A) of Barypeithes pellucidus]|uniref:IS110 family transposase n=1 Tax=Wolbachia endosymbiont (group A) of Barypeithes pellucidus TaxID=3139322 RepID=UPI003CCA9E58
MRYIGVDLHTNSFTVCYLETGKQECIRTFHLQDLDNFVEGLKSEDEIAFEATGNSCFFYDAVSSYVKRAVIIAPWQFEVIRRSVKKTDRHDARAIAFFLSKDMLPEARCKSKQCQQLASLLRTREQLVKSQVSLINKMHGLFNYHGIKIKKETLTTKAGFERSIQKHNWDYIEKIEIEVISYQLEAIRENLKKLKEEITAFAKQLPGFNNIISIKGIGAISAAVFITTIGDINDFSNPEKLTAYFGVVPSVSQSNQQCTIGRITKYGPKMARTSLVQCTWVAIRYSPYLKSFYEHVKKKRGSAKAIIATARKFLTTIFYTLKRNWIFEDFTKFEFFIEQ